MGPFREGLVRLPRGGALLHANASSAAPEAARVGSGGMKLDQHHEPTLSG